MRAAARYGFLCAVIATTTPAVAQTAAGTRITNIASASFVREGETSTLTSNAVTTCVDEQLDLLLQAQTSASASSVAFTLTNKGNGPETFALAAAVDGKDAALSIRIDADGNGLFDAAVDTTVIERSTPILAAGGTLNILVLTDDGVGADATTITLSANAETGTGATGSSFAGRGEGSCDAVIGASAGSASASAMLAEGGPPASIVKSQQVQGADGSATPQSGATITYRLEVVTTARGVLRGAFITDPLPAGTEYLPGSLRLDDTILSDADDADAGAFDGGQIRVALGDVPSAVSRTVTFQVKIK
ncbi:MAG: hypothetical protein ACSLE1_10845 [Sphingobium sp.]